MHKARKQANTRVEKAGSKRVFVETLPWNKFPIIYDGQWEKIRSEGGENFYEQKIDLCPGCGLDAGNRFAGGL